MWQSPMTLLPDSRTVVLCLDDAGIYCATVEHQYAGTQWDGCQWTECDMRGESTWHLGSPPPSREPNWWTHLPGGLGRLKAT